MPPPASLQQLCELGSEQLIQTQYLQAETTLARAEAEAYAARDWDTLARLYMPLQEARRQKRQRCGEGVVALDLIAENAHDKLDGRRILENFPHGQLLVAGWHTTEPAARIRQLARELELYVETFLGAVFRVAGRRVIVVTPLEDSALPPLDYESLEQLQAHLPPNCMLIDEGEVTRGHRKGTPQTFGEVMAIWERMHAPYLAAADAEADAIRRIDDYRLTTRVDYACELAHQKLSDVAHDLAREARGCG
jgi:hypothetical protein